MRSTPALAASSNTRREPSTLSSRVASLASRIANARWTTTSAPLTSVARRWPRRSRRPGGTPSSSSRARPGRTVGAPCRRCASPRASAPGRSRSRCRDRPVGPVTATVRPVARHGAVLSDWDGVDVLAAAQHVDRVRRDRVVSRGRSARDRVRPSAASMRSLPRAGGRSSRRPGPPDTWSFPAPVRMRSWSPPRRRRWWAPPIAVIVSFPPARQRSSCPPRPRRSCHRRSRASTKSGPPLA